MSSADDYTIVKVTRTANKFDCFLSFLIEMGITSDSAEGDNKVTITRKAVGNSCTDSYLIVRLDKEEEYIAKILEGGKFAAVNVRSLSLAKSPKSASVRISRHLKCRSSANCNDYDSCTSDGCVNFDRYGEGICVYTPLPCDACGSNIKTSSATNEFPESFSWELENMENKAIILSSGTNQEATTEYAESKCLAYGEYKILFKYTQNVTHDENVTCSVQAEEIMFSDESTGEPFEAEEFFTVCSSDNDCNDYDGCTLDFCNSTTRMCENKVLGNESCSNCSLVTLEFIPDNYPDETR